MSEWKDWNKMSIEEHIEHLQDKFQFDSSGTSKAVYELIAAYRALNIDSVVGQSEQLSCPECDSTSVYSTDPEIYHDCNNCGHDWTT